MFAIRHKGVYSAGMTEADDEAIRAATHKDLILLIKEYARQGYEHAHAGTDGDFEQLWRATFHITERESVIPAKK